MVDHLPLMQLLKVVLLVKCLDVMAQVSFFKAMIHFYVAHY